MSDRQTELGYLILEATKQIEAVTGMPAEGPYPATIGEIADNLRDLASEQGFVVVDTRDEATFRLIENALCGGAEEQYTEHVTHADKRAAVLAALAKGGE